MSLSTTGSNLLAIENDPSIGSFKTNARKVSFNQAHEVFTYDKNSHVKHATNELDDTVPTQAMSDDGLHDGLRLDPAFKNNNTADEMITENRRLNRKIKISNEDSVIPILESSEGAEITLVPEQCLLLILRSGFDLTMTITHRRFSLCKETC